MIDPTSGAPDDGGEETEQQAVIVHLDAVGLSDDVYRSFDLAGLEDQLESVLQGANGEYDGNEYGPSEVVLFLFGKDADKLFQSVEKVLRAHPLCKGARVELRYGDIGAERREFVL